MVTYLCHLCPNPRVLYYTVHTTVQHFRKRKKNREDIYTTPAVQSAMEKKFVWMAAHARATTSDPRGKTHERDSSDVCAFE